MLPPASMTANSSGATGHQGNSRSKPHELQPANEEMEPIYADPEDVEIQGKVIGVIRKLV